MRAIRTEVRKSRESLPVRYYYYSVSSDRHGHRVGWWVAQSADAIAVQTEFSVSVFKVGGALGRRGDWSKRGGISGKNRIRRYRTLLVSPCAEKMDLRVPNDPAITVCGQLCSLDFTISPFDDVYPRPILSVSVSHA